MSPKTTPRSSPHTSKRMLSPSIRLRATKPKSYRPLSQSVSAGPGEMGDSFDSDDDLLREFAASGGAGAGGGGGATASMVLLAENFKKLEKSGKLKNWNIAKLKAPRKSSFTQLSGKFSKSYQALNRRFRSESTKSAKSVDRDALSDNEDSDNSSATPLLSSTSANNLVPPPKPARTFKQRTLDLTGDDEVANVLLFNSQDDDFSGDVLSAIREMGVLQVATGGCEESREERFSKSLPNGGLKILSSTDDSLQISSNSHVSQTPLLHSPRNMSPLATEPPTRAVLPPPILSPVHEAESHALEREASAQDDNPDPTDSVLSPASTVDSYQTSVFGEAADKPTFEPLDPIEDGDVPQDGTEADGEEVSKTNADTSTVTLVSKPEPDPATNSTSDHSSVGISSQKSSEDSNDGFTEFQSAEPLTTHSSDPATLTRTQESKVSANTLTAKEFDPKRMSTISVASTDWYSLDEDEGEEEEDNISNYSNEFPELRCSMVNYAEVCQNVTEDDHPLFSTPPTSPPLATMTLGRMKKKRMESHSDRSSSNSPRPKSASPLDSRTGHLEGIAAGDINLLRRSCSPRLKCSTSSRSPSSRESRYEEVEDDRTRTLRPKQSNGLSGRLAPDVNSAVRADGSREDSEEPQYVSTHEISQPSSMPPLLVTAPSEDVVTETGELEETFEDATETSLDDLSELNSTSAVSMNAAYTVTRSSNPLQKSYSANTSPSTTEKRKYVLPSALTRSSTDCELSKRRHGVHVRSQSTTVGGASATVTTPPPRGLEEAPHHPKEDEYVAKLIRKTSKDETDSSDRVTSFSKQDFADILRSSLRGSKVPLVRIESADDKKVERAGEDGAPVEEGDGGEGEGEGGERGTLSPSHLTTPSSSGGSQEVTVEPVIIPDVISPNMVSVYTCTMYVCTSTCTCT